MTRERALALLVGGFVGVQDWNRWRSEGRTILPPSLRGAYLSARDLQHADLHDVELIMSNLAGADLKAASLRAADLTRATLDSCRGEGMDGRHCKLIGASLKAARLGQANLEGACLDGADLSGVNLDRANLRGASLKGARLENASLREADLRDANLESATLAHADLSDARFSGARLVEANLECAYLARADLTRVVGMKAKLRGANLLGASLGGADIGRADLTNACLLGADLRNLRFGEATLEGSQLDFNTALSADADLLSARWDTINIGQGSYSRANVEQGREALPIGMRAPSSARQASASEYEPYPPERVDELEALTRERISLRAGPVAEEQLQRRVDQLVTYLRRRPSVNDVVAGGRLIRILGKGNYGTVWEAAQVATGTRIAVKTFDPDRLGLGLSLYHFRRGVRAMQHLSKSEGCPSTIVGFFEAEQSNLAFSMTLVPDRDLTNIDARGWRLGAKMQTFRATCEAVAFAHAQGVIHRDIKPANVVMRGKTPVLTDFDIADLLFAKTASSQAFGSVGYSAPEALNDTSGAHEPTVDVFGLGRLLYFMLLERDPPLEFEQVPKLDDIQAKHPGIAQIVRKCTMRDRALRYQTIGKLLDDLNEVETSPARVGTPILEKADAETGTRASPAEENPAVRLSRRRAQLRAAKADWERAHSYALQKRWEAALTVGRQALITLGDADPGRGGDWKATLQDWEAKTGRRGAAERWWRKQVFARLPLPLALCFPAFGAALIWLLKNVATGLLASPALQPSVSPSQPVHPHLDPSTMSPAPSGASNQPSSNRGRSIASPSSSTPTSAAGSVQPMSSAVTAPSSR